VVDDIAQTQKGLVGEIDIEYRQAQNKDQGRSLSLPDLDQLQHNWRCGDTMRTRVPSMPTLKVVVHNSPLATTSKSAPVDRRVLPDRNSQTNLKIPLHQIMSEVLVFFNSTLFSYVEDGVRNIQLPKSRPRVPLPRIRSTANISSCLIRQLQPTDLRPSRRCSEVADEGDHRVEC
jgi:hypothetical protein